MLGWGGQGAGRASVLRGDTDELKINFISEGFPGDQSGFLHRLLSSPSQILSQCVHST